MPAAHSKLVLKSTNNLLDFLKELKDVPCGLPSASIISTELDISRTTVQKIIAILLEKGLARQDGTNKILLRRPEKGDYFSPEESGNSKSDQVEKQVLKKLSAYELRPGDRFSELELARELGTSTIIMREALFKIGQSGIIKKHPHQKWEVIEFSPELIDEIAIARKLFEDAGIQAMHLLPDHDPIWNKFEDLEVRHRKLLKQKQISHQEMRTIERDFHTAIVEATHNRFIQHSYNSIFTLVVFHLWQIEYDKRKIESVLKHHLLVLAALAAKDFDRASQEMQHHLEYAKESMMHVNKVLNQ
jgi:GntR family transcriptional regulator, transcriptional activator for L-galactonate catabolism